MSLVVKFALRVVRERLVLLVGNVPRVVGRFDRCPCCGERVFVEA